MQHIHNQPRIANGPETTGRTIHWAGHYDLMSRLFRMGVDSANSRMVAELAQIKPGNRVLDVACGTGNLTLTAQSYTGPNGQVYGIDAAPEMIEVATRKAARSGRPVTFQVGLIEQLEFPEANFDVVITRLAIHHLPDDLKRRAFGEVLRVLKPGGHFLITDFTPPSNPLLSHITSALVGPHMMRTNTTQLPAILESAGFVDVTSGPTRSAFLTFVSGKKPGH